MEGDGGRAEGKKRPWTAEEDEALRRRVRDHGRQKWAEIALGLPGRGPKSCRLRWWQHLSPELDSGAFTPAEDALIVEQQRVHGNKWATIARCLPGRSDNAVKNRWNSTLRKLLQAAGTLPSATATGEDAAASTDDGQDDAPPVCLELFPLRAGGVKEAATAASAAAPALVGSFVREKEEYVTDAELALSLWSAWPATG
ncbi:hypothetical protein GUJ93_ZPchr0010g8005 [Zizania palustris]|uniref:Uncharacterized protein n=1 Tax=Zizania palustris TaxID=103762 RepID=A0A8J5WB69_ZIZPA|nr:hypothetical protein GUJ93_ZPchr0010g8005 [Zizania palustris]